MARASQVVGRGRVPLLRTTLSVTGTALLITGTALLLAAATLARADEYYGWTDDQGRRHFSDSYNEVPERYRDQLGELPRSFEERAGVSVVDGLDRRYAKPEDPNAQSAPRVPALSARELPSPAQLRELGAAAFAQASLAMLVGMGVALLGVLALGLALGALILMLACRLSGQLPPSLLRGMTISGVQMAIGLLVGLIMQLVLLGVATAAPEPARVVALAGVQMLLVFSLDVASLRGLLCETLGRALVVQIVLILVSLAIGVALAIGLILMGLVFSCSGG